MRRDAMGVYYLADSSRFSLKTMELYPMELLTFKERPRTVFISPKERFDVVVDPSKF
jgi:hypothetical protein